jgi:hypothetical protein
MNVAIDARQRTRLSVRKRGRVESELAATATGAAAHEKSRLRGCGAGGSKLPKLAGAQPQTDKSGLIFDDTLLAAI